MTGESEVLARPGAASPTALSSLRSRRAAFALGALGLIGLAAFIRVQDPAQSSLYPVCLFHAVTGLHCPGCGIARALHHLVHGEVSAAFWRNPLVVPLIPWLLYLFVRAGVDALRGAPPRRRRLHPRLIWALAFATAAFWILRNIPVHPFTELAP
jgi:hypothetical protein